MNDKIFTFLKNVLAILLVILTPSLSFTMGYEPLSKYDSECTAVIEKMGGFMTGVCHAEPDYKLIKNAGINWHRKDIPFP